MGVFDDAKETLKAGAEKVEHAVHEGVDRVKDKADEVKAEANVKKAEAEKESVQAKNEAKEELRD